MSQAAPLLVVNATKQELAQTEMLQLALAATEPDGHGASLGEKHLDLVTAFRSYFGLGSRGPKERPERVWVF